MFRCVWMCSSKNGTALAIVRIVTIRMHLRTTDNKNMLQEKERTYCENRMERFVLYMACRTISCDYMLFW